MANKRVEKEKNYSIVLVGKFLPPVFQPAWLGAKRLIRDSEVEKADIKIIHPSVTQFSLPWGNILVETEKFAITTNDVAGAELARQLVTSVFGILPPAPVTALGMNVHCHFQVENESVWHEIGHRLAPKKEIWEKVLKKPGTRSLLVEGEHEDGSPGNVRVRIEPSILFPNSIYVDINDHYTIGTKDEKGTATDAVKVISEKSKSSDANSEKIIGFLMATL